MADPDKDEFVRRCNEGSREARQAGVSNSKLAECLMKMARKEFRESPKVRSEYNSFTEFAKDIEFKVQKQDEEIRASSTMLKTSSRNIDRGTCLNPLFPV